VKALRLTFGGNVVVLHLGAKSYGLRSRIRSVTAAALRNLACDSAEWALLNSSIVSNFDQIVIGPIG